jgi:hypothetical protein
MPAVGNWGTANGAEDHVRGARNHRLRGGSGMYINTPGREAEVAIFRIEEARLSKIKTAIIMADAAIQNDHASDQGLFALRQIISNN